METNLIDKHTHYELNCHVGPYSATLQIPGYVFDEFLAKHGKPITKVGMLRFAASFIPEGELVDECRNPYRSASHRRGTITSIDKISEAE